MLTRRLYYLVLLALAVPAVAQRSPSRYADALHGFSIRPPAGSRVIRKTAATELVQFALADSAGGAVRLRMSILQGVEKTQPVTDLAAYGRSLAAQLGKDQNFQIESAVPLTTTVAGRPALVLQGVVGGAQYGRYRRDVWVLAAPNRFLVIRTSGSPEDSAEIVDLSTAATASLRLFDPEATRAKLERDLARGGSLLDGLSRPELSAALAKREYWMAAMAGGKMVGFVHVTERPVVKEGAEGFEVITRSARIASDGQRTLAVQEAFCSFGRDVAKWTSFAADVVNGAETGRSQMFGLMQNDVLIVQRVIGRHQTKSSTRNLPHGVYAPQAVSALLPRLIDRSVAGSYAFAEFNPSSNDLDMRTLTVVGPKAVTLGGKPFSATLLTDQPALGAPAAQVYVDGAGLPLKIVREDGSVLQQTTAAAIRARFASELKMLTPAR